MTIKIINTKAENIMLVIDMEIPNKLKIIICLVAVVSVASAKDFGKHGYAYEIREKSFCVDMQERVAKVNIEEIEKEVKEKVAQTINEPKALSLARAQESRKFHFDPSYVLPKDIVLPCGKILHKAGKKVNPLDYMSLSRRMIFIDGRDNKQVEWLRESLSGTYKEKKQTIDEPEPKNYDLLESKRTELENRIILTGGRIFELEKELDSKLYFDQAGELTSKFGIYSLPATVEQDGKLLKINEIALNSRNENAKNRELNK